MSPRHRGSSLLLYLILLLAAFFEPRIAWAADDSLARAKVHFENGVHLFDQKPPDYDAALAEFRAAEKEHASPGIKKNIALCLKALHRYGEAIDELDAMLAAPPDTLKPETREAGKKILAEIQALIATLRIKVVLHRSADQTGNDVPHVDVALDGQSVPAEKLAGSVRTGPGDHVVVAHASGYGDATKKIAVVAGDKDVLVQLDLVPVGAGAGLGSLHVHSNIDKAQISIDNVALANGSWEGGLPAGHHHIEVASAGYPTWSKDIDVLNGQRVDLEATLGQDNVPPPPPPYGNGNGNGDKPAPAKEPERPWYLMGGIGAYTATYTMAGPSLAAGPTGPLGDQNSTQRGFNGLLLNARGGRDFGKFVSLELFLEVGGAKPASWKSGATAQNETPVDATIAYGALGPEFRVHSPGKVVRVILGTGFAIEAVSVTVNSLVIKAPGGGSSQTFNKKGGGAEGLWLLEGGAQFRLGSRMFIETDLFFDVSGDGSIKDSDNSDRYFESSPLIRSGLRAFFGLTL